MTFESKGDSSLRRGLLRRIPGRQGGNSLPLSLVLLLAGTAGLLLAGHCSLALWCSYVGCSAACFAGLQFLTLKRAARATPRFLIGAGAGADAGGCARPKGPGMLQIFSSFALASCFAVLSLVPRSADSGSAMVQVGGPRPLDVRDDALFDFGRDTLLSSSRHREVFALAGYAVRVEVPGFTIRDLLRQHEAAVRGTGKPLALRSLDSSSLSISHRKRGTALLSSTAETALEYENAAVGWRRDAQLGEGNAGKVGGLSRQPALEPGRRSSDSAAPLIQPEGLPTSAPPVEREGGESILPRWESPIRFPEGQRLEA